MDWITVILLILIVAFIVVRLMPPRGIKRISTDELQDVTKDPKGKQIIDVREPDEYRSGHIHMARNIPLTQINTAVNGIPKDKATYLICESGFRATQAARVLRKKGFTNIYSVKGGMKQWKGKVVKK